MGGKEQEDDWITCFAGITTNKVACDFAACGFVAGVNGPKGIQQLKTLSSNRLVAAGAESTEPRREQFPRP